MVEPTRRAAPLAVFRPANPPAPSQLGAGSVLALPSGHVAGDLRPLGIDVRRRVALYELRITNETATPLISFAYPLGPTQPGGTVSWSTVRVPPRTSVAVPVEIPISRRRPLERVVAELHGDGVHLTFDADPPKRSNGRFRAAGLAAAALLGVLSSGAYALERPQVAALAAPERVRAEQPFQVAYAIGPAADRADYSVVTADGRVVAQGTLKPQGSAFAVTLPASRRSTGYDVRVTAANRFGQDRRVTHILAVAPEPARGVKHSKPSAAFALETDTVEGGQPIVLHYPSAVGTGTLKLLDQDGTERASGLLGKRGSSIVVAPKVEIAQDFRLVIDVRHGANVAESALPVRIVPTAPHPALPKSPKTKTGANGPEGSPIVLGTAKLRSGQPIVVTIRRYAPNLEIALMDDKGEELRKVAVRPEDKQLNIEAPSVIDDARFLIVATFNRGAGQESVIQSILVRHR
jgi:hypothetical protein